MSKIIYEIFQKYINKELDYQKLIWKIELSKLVYIEIQKSENNYIIPDIFALSNISENDSKSLYKKISNGEYFDIYIIKNVFYGYRLIEYFLITKEFGVAYIKKIS